MSIKIAKLNVVPFDSTKFITSESNILDLNKEQLTQVYENMCNYFGVSSSNPKELEGIKRIRQRYMYIGSTDEETIKRLYGQK